MLALLTLHQNPVVLRKIEAFWERIFEEAVKIACDWNVSGSFDPGYVLKDRVISEDLRFGHETEIVHLILTFKHRSTWCGWMVEDQNIQAAR
jgi:hypothetical protein